MIKRIAILGDFNPQYTTHHALNDSIRHVKQIFDTEVQFDWIGTDIFDHTTAFKDLYHGLWIAPGSPYKNMDNVLAAIKYTRENNIPTFGNCGGFQAMIIEFARNVCNIQDADHEETNPNAGNLIISKLACSLVEKQETLHIVNIKSHIKSIIKNNPFTGKYFCSYGVNPYYTEILKDNGLSLTVISEDENYRAFELSSHKFFLGTLFQPALSSAKEQPDPIIVEFIRQV